MSGFWTSFFDGLTGEGIFGDLRRPGAPTIMFKPDPPVETLIVIRSETDRQWTDEERDALLQAVRFAVERVVGAKATVSVPESAEEE